MIRVFDENGSKIGQTYPRRVKGLIKKGRARFMDERETAIVLADAKPNFRNTEACPPNNKLILSEDIKMTANTVIDNVYDDNSKETVTVEIPEELRRLYDKLDEIDGKFFKLVDEKPDELDDALCMRMLLMFEEMRSDTVHMIEAYKKEHGQVAENPVERCVNAQVQNLQTMLTSALDELTRRYAENGDISEDDFCERYELLCNTFDNRLAKLLTICE